MITTIDNNQRKFLVQSQGLGNTKDIFCNLADIPNVIKTAFEKNEEFKIYEFWNRKLKVCSKKHLNEMFSANQITKTRFTFKFNGREKGAIGIFQNYLVSYDAFYLKEAEDMLYNNYEHITQKTVKTTIINLIK